MDILVEQAVVLCQVEKAKEDMLNQLYSSIRLIYLIIYKCCLFQCVYFHMFFLITYTSICLHIHKMHVLFLL